MHKKARMIRIVSLLVFLFPCFFSEVKSIGTQHLTNLNLNAQPITVDGYAEIATSEAAFNSAVTWSGVSGGILTYPSDVTLNGTWLFLGTTILTGATGILTLGASGALVVGDGATLIITDMNIYGVGQHNIRCQSATSNLSIRNTSLYMTSDWTYTIGLMNIAQYCDVRGTYTLSYQSQQACSLGTVTEWTFYNNTFQYAPAAALSNLLTFADETSILRLDGGTLASTTTQLQLTLGALEACKTAICRNDATNYAQGLVIGDGISSSNDFHITILPASDLQFHKGYYLYNNRRGA